MNDCSQSYLSSYLSKCNDWRPTQELLITRFAPTEYFEMFRTINQDYGSFYYHKQTSSCIPDVLKEKDHKRYMNWLIEQTCHRSCKNQYPINFFPQCQTQTVTITHRKKFPPCK